jgi:hypothetical protein
MEGALIAVEGRFHENLERVTDLVDLYDRVTGLSPGRPSVQESELLRIAVVFLHAALEVLLRDLAEWRLPAASAEVLSQIPCVGGDGRRTTLTLGDLAAHRGRSVEYVISKSVIAYLDRSSYNNPEDVAKLLGQVGLPQKAKERLMGAHARGLRTLMSRRHQIAHRLDRNDFLGRGHHVALSISKTIVGQWISVVRQFGDGLLAELRNLPLP